MQYGYIIVACCVYCTSKTSLKQLSDILVEEWDKILLETIQVLYECIPQEIEGVLNANDGPTPY
jgi:hypothetical protein